MERSREAKRARLRLILIVAGSVLLFGAMMSDSVMHRHPPGYLDNPPPGQFTYADWTVLQQADWLRPSKPALPDEARALDGKPVKAHGFLLPLHKPGPAAQFFMSDKVGGCYFCSPPGVSSVILLNLAGGKVLSPCGGIVDAYGTFHVARGLPTDRVLYWMDEVVLVAF